MNPYSLTLRNLKGAALTHSELDANFQHLNYAITEVSGLTSGSTVIISGASVESVTLAELTSLVASSGLTHGGFYEITDSTCSYFIDKVRLMANSVSTFEPSATGLFWYPDYRLSLTGNTSINWHTENIWTSAPHLFGITFFSIGDVFIFGGIRFQNTTGGNSNPIQGVDWSRLDFSLSNGYIQHWNDIQYNLQEDKLLYRREFVLNTNINSPTLTHYQCENEWHSSYWGDYLLTLVASIEFSGFTGSDFMMWGGGATNCILKGGLLGNIFNRGFTTNLNINNYSAVFALGNVSVTNLRHNYGFTTFDGSILAFNLDINGGSNEAFTSVELFNTGTSDRTSLSIGNTRVIASDIQMANSDDIANYSGGTLQMEDCSFIHSSFICAEALTKFGDWDGNTFEYSKVNLYGTTNISCDVFGNNFNHADLEIAFNPNGTDIISIVNCDFNQGGKALDDFAVEQTSRGLFIGKVPTGDVDWHTMDVSNIIHMGYNTINQTTLNLAGNVEVFGNNISAHLLTVVGERGAAEIYYNNFVLRHDEFASITPRESLVITDNQELFLPLNVSKVYLESNNAGGNYSVFLDLAPDAYSSGSTHYFNDCVLEGTSVYTYIKRYGTSGTTTSDLDTWFPFFNTSTGEFIMPTQMMYGNKLILDGGTGTTINKMALRRDKIFDIETVSGSSITLSYSPRAGLLTGSEFILTQASDLTLSAGAENISDSLTIKTLNGLNFEKARNIYV